jgi:preprotein translocase subunit SecD
MRAHPLRNMLVVMGLALGLLVLTIVLGKSPTLGLDLQGGVSVNLQPVDEAGDVLGDVDAEDLDQAIGIIRKRVDAVGVTEPEVARQGSTITVQLPGATDQQEVIDLVGTTARLRFRPVLAFLGPEPTDAEREEISAEIERISGELGLPEGVTASQVLQEETQAIQAATGGDPAAPAPEGPLNSYGIDVQSEQFQQLAALESQLASQVTPREDIRRESEVVLADRDGNLWRLGPTWSSGDLWLEGEAVDDAVAG